MADSTEQTEPTASRSLFVAAVGASAGGVEALCSFFDSIPSDLDMAFVVVTHLGRHRDSQLPDILARHTSMSVIAVHGDEELVAGCVYVLPPDAVLTIRNCRLQLRPLGASERERNPIDVFFSSLAEDLREAAIGIVLSGAGSDGTLGIKAIKEQGGLTIAQGHGQIGPRHDSMPESAIASGVVDIVAATEEIGAKLLDYVRSFQSLQAIADEGAHRTQEEMLRTALSEIHEILRKRVGHDFADYKERTFLRRVQRRMQVLQLFTLDEYVERLRQEPAEAGLLFRDLLIGVTSFFRDGDAFDALANLVIPRLFESAGASDTVRIWVPGCATGEEAYSIAIIVREHMASLDTSPRVEIFATDIDERALSTARAARYPAAMLAHVSAERLKRFFRAEPGSFVLAKEVRDLCIFSAHSVIRDPPFSRVDLVSCRNLLIYFDVQLQDSVLPVFHYALKPRGYLFLGPSENASRHGDLFVSVDTKNRIFQRCPTINTHLRLPSVILKGHEGVVAHDRAPRVSRADQRFRQHVESRVMDVFAPAHIVVEADGNIVYYSARTGKYLEPQIGSPSRQLLSMARRGLRLELRSALREAVESGRTVVRARIDVEMDDRVQPIRLVIEPMLEAEHGPLFLVVFTDLGPPVTHEEAALRRPTDAADDAQVERLEQELKETRERLQATIEEYETALEELKSGNEEMVSVNEELQSTNEELETSKEELQSLNEELQTVNHELATKVDELHRANSDLQNLFESTQMATVFLDRFMIIRSYTPAVTAIFNLIASDRGRPLTDIAHQLEDVDLRSDIRRVLDERKPLERPVHLRDSRIFHLMRILPYRTNDDEIDGVLVTFIDVSAMIAAEEQQRLMVAELNHRVRNMLQVVMGLANQTLHRSKDLDAFNKAFMGRMQSLSRAYDLLSRDSWLKVPMKELIATQLAAFSLEESRYSAAGPPAVLTANASLALGMVFYELATNAMKYGAFSVATGRIAITWRIDDGEQGRTLVICWIESGGPKVRQPERQGFGSQLVHHQLRYEFNGKAEADFGEDGLRMTLSIPADSGVLAEVS